MPQASRAVVAATAAGGGAAPASDSNACGDRGATDSTVEKEAAESTALAAAKTTGHSLQQKAVAYVGKSSTTFSLRFADAESTTELNTLRNAFV